LCGNEGKKASVKQDEIAILPALLEIITYLCAVHSRQRSKNQELLNSRSSHGIFDGCYIVCNVNKRNGV
ncbi:MAG: hypothetical protein MSS63_06195, partial [Blautia glucerasea]|nr:hypothetical protein [Blautia glucerasea]